MRYPYLKYETVKDLVFARETFSFCIRTVRSKLRIPQENNTRQIRLSKTVVFRICNRTLSELIETIYGSVTQFRETKAAWRTILL